MGDAGDYSATQARASGELRDVENPIELAAAPEPAAAAVEAPSSSAPPGATTGNSGTARFTSIVRWKLYVGVIGAVVIIALGVSIGVGTVIGRRNRAAAAAATPSSSSSSSATDAGGERGGVSGNQTFSSDINNATNNIATSSPGGATGGGGDGVETRIPESDATTTTSPVAGSNTGVSPAAPVTSTTRAPDHSGSRTATPSSPGISVPASPPAPALLPQTQAPASSSPPAVPPSPQTRAPVGSGMGVVTASPVGAGVNAGDNNSTDSTVQPPPQVDIPPDVFGDTNSTSAGAATDGGQLPPCQQDVNCSVVLMGALEPALPPESRILIDFPGTCQNTARTWLRNQTNSTDLPPERIRQRFALAVFYCELDGENWANQGLWMSEYRECDWLVNTAGGINYCDQSNLLQILRMPNQHLKGTLPPELSMISTLWEVDVSSNDIAGTIPSGYASLTELDTSSIRSNHMQGTIPHFVWEFEDMNYLDLSCNSFSGTIPVGVSRTEPSLRTLLVGNNALSGSIPTDFGVFDWKRLHLQNNRLSGTIPATISAPRLEELLLHNNQLTGYFPSSNFLATGESIGLRRITLYDNDIEGDLNPMCQLFFTTGNFEALEVDLTKVSCQCCAPGKNDDSCAAIVPIPPVSPVPTPIDPPVSVPTGLVVAPAPPTVDENPAGPSIPFPGVTTTPFDPYERDDCFWGDNIFPHVLNQCQCFNTISVVPDDVGTLYQQVRTKIQKIDGGFYSEEIDSCAPSNQALVWLSTGNTRDSGDLYQRFVLSLFYIQTNGTVWDSDDLWLSDESECTWFGVKCDSNFGVSSIGLSTNNLHGSLISEMQYLSDLRSLDISRNMMTGTIPGTIFSIPVIESILLYANSFQGPLPAAVGRGTDLKALQVQNNVLSRTLPASINSLTNLVFLELDSNRFSGTFPSVDSLRRLQVLSSSQNVFTGTLPASIVQLDSLQELDLSQCGFSGTIPLEVGLLTSLKRLSLGFNSLVGTVPDTLGRLAMLEWLSLRNNRLSGAVPSTLGFLSFLQRLELDGNSLSSSVPSEICDLRLLDLETFVVDCPEQQGSTGGTVSGGGGIECPVPSCCTLCRRA